MKTSIFDINLTKRMKSIWKFSLVVYIICSTAFSYNALYRLNQIALYLFLGISLICLFAKKSIRVNIFVVSLAFFLLYMLIGTIYSTSSNSMKVTYDFFIVVCLVFCVYNYVESEDDVFLIFKTVMYGGLVLDMYNVYLYGDGFFLALQNETRFGGLAGNLNMVGMMSANSAIIGLFFLLNHDNTAFKKFAYMVIITICSFFALITASRKVLILLVLGVFFLFLFRRNKKKKSFVVLKNFLISAVCTVIALYIIFNIEYFDDITIRFEQMMDLFLSGKGDASSNARMSFIETGLQVFINKPLFGDGTAASYSYFGTYSHCNFVEILMNHGIIGFVIFYFSYPFFFVKVLDNIKSRKNGESNISLLCFFIVVSTIILSIAYVYYTVVYNQILIAVSFSCVAMKKEPEKNVLKGCDLK